MLGLTATFVGGLVGLVARSVHPGGRCMVCDRRFRDLDRHWTTAHEWIAAATRAPGQPPPESSPSPSTTTTR